MEVQTPERSREALEKLEQLLSSPFLAETLASEVLASQELRYKCFDLSPGSEGRKKIEQLEGFKQNFRKEKNLPFLVVYHTLNSPFGQEIKELNKGLVKFYEQECVD